MPFKLWRNVCIYHSTKRFQAFRQISDRHSKINQTKTQFPLYHPNEFFSSYWNIGSAKPKIAFPIGKQKNNENAHIVVNAHDITPTVNAILAHKPCHVVLWKLNVAGTEQQNELDGKTAFLASYLSGNLLQTLDDLGLKFKGKMISKSRLFLDHPS